MKFESLTFNLSQWRKGGSTFSWRDSVAASQYAESAANLKTSCVCACPNVISQSCAWALPQELGHWFCSQYSWLLWGTVYRSYCQITGSSSNLDSNLNFAAWPTSCEGFVLSAQKSQNTMFGVGILLRYVKNAKGSGKWRHYFNAHPPPGQACHKVSFHIWIHMQCKFIFFC